MQIIPINPQQPEPERIKRAAHILLNKGVIGYPTETVYGLGAHALQPVAIEKIYRLKKRDTTKPVLIIAGSVEMVSQLVKVFPPVARQLAHAFWPGPLTMIFPVAEVIPSIIHGPGTTIGIRIPGHRICLELLRACGVPITSTSANITGGANPISAAEVVRSMGEQLDAVIDGGVAASRTASTVIDISNESPILVREGIISKQVLESFLKKPIREKT